MSNPLVRAGRKAPALKLKDKDQKQVSLKDFAGSWVVLYFYPRDNTPGCTLQATDFTAMKRRFSGQGAVIIGVSKDSCASHQRFIEKQGLKIALLSDPESVVQKKYGVWQLKKFMGREAPGTVRSTFLIDPEGKIVKNWYNVKARGHAEEVLAVLKEARSQC